MNTIDDLAAKAADECAQWTDGLGLDADAARDIIASAIREALREPLEALADVVPDGSAMGMRWVNGEFCGEWIDRQRATLAKWGAR